MNTKFLLSPAYLVSVLALIVGALLSNTQYMVVGWIIFIIGLALNAMGLVVLANREYLHQAQRVGIVPKKSAGKSIKDVATQEPAAEETSVSAPAMSARGKKREEIAESKAIFPHSS